MSGLFITFEGIDGCGKSTQLQRCAELFQAQGQDVVITRNPGGMPFGQELRQILLHYPGHVTPISELLLFIADRAQHMDEVVFPALAQGKVILCDRHLDSTKAYQGYGRGLSLELIDQLNALAIQGKKPDLTFLFDGDPLILAQRVNHRGQADRLEGSGQIFFNNVREGFLAIAASEPERVVVMDATMGVEDLSALVSEKIKQRLPAKN